MTRVTRGPILEVERSKVKVTKPINDEIGKCAISSKKGGDRRTSDLVQGWSKMTRITDMRGDVKGQRLKVIRSRRQSDARLAVWCSGNALVSINAVALHRARLVLGWVTAFGQVNCLIT